MWKKLTVSKKSKIEKYIRAFLLRIQQKYMINMAIENTHKKMRNKCTNTI